MKWSNNSVACKTIWTTLMVFEQISERQLFKTTGDKKMSDLPFFAKDGTDAVKKARAKSLAIQFDKYFRIARGAKYESDVNKKKAVDSLVTVMKEADKLVVDLADVADDMYLFYREEVTA